MTDRIRRTNERLQQQLGSSSKLAPINPAQPGAGSERDREDAPRAVSQGGAAQDAAPSTPREVRAEKSRPEPQSTHGSAQPIRSASELDTRRRYSIMRDGAPLLALPDADADTIATLIGGDTVVALQQFPKGAWTAVQFGAGADAKRGWVATPSLMSISPK